MQLEKIWNSSLQTNKEPIGILTSQHRNTWGKAYNNLIKGEQSGNQNFQETLCFDRFIILLRIDQVVESRRVFERKYVSGKCLSCSGLLSSSSSEKTNKESVRAIQKSIFTVCLDAPMPRVSDELYPSRVAAQMLHGGGARWNSGNRWFDKTLQVSVRQMTLHSQCGTG